MSTLRRSTFNILAKRGFMFRKWLSKQNQIDDIGDKVRVWGKTFVVTRIEQTPDMHSGIRIQIEGLTSLAKFGGKYP